MSIMLGFALILFGLSKLVKDPIFIFVSGIIFLFVGLNVFVGGIDIQSGIYTEEIFQYGNNFENYTTDAHWEFDTGTAPEGKQLEVYLFHTSTNEIIQYEERDTVLNHGFGGVLMWLGIYILIVGWSMYKNEKEEKLLG